MSIQHPLNVDNNPQQKTMKVKLKYIPIDNFGDQLNPWIWSNLLPNSLDVSEENCYPDRITPEVSLLSIGSYLSDALLVRFTPNNKAIIAGTGCGYGVFSTTFSSWGSDFPYKSKLGLKLPINQSKQPYTDSMRFYWVRGPLSSHFLGLPKETAVADGAYLLRKILPIAKDSQRHGIAFMPHIYTAKLSPLEQLCDLIGFTYIDPREPMMNIINKIATAEVLVTEALHGAIVSDALRTPWIPVRASQAILDFKWIDHCSAIKLDYKPIDISAVWLPSEVAKTQRSWLKKMLFGARATLSNWRISPEQVAMDLLYASQSQPFLSSDTVMASIDEKLDQLLDKIKKDINEDPFFLT